MRPLPLSGDPHPVGSRRTAKAWDSLSTLHVRDSQGPGLQHLIQVWVFFALAVFVFQLPFALHFNCLCIFLLSAWCADSLSACVWVSGTVLLLSMLQNWGGDNSTAGLHPASRPWPSGSCLKRRSSLGSRSTPLTPPWVCYEERWMPVRVTPFINSGLYNSGVNKTET